MDDLLAAIRRDLDDDAPRLVYADVLQRAGDPRGELIAVQCELERLGEVYQGTYAWEGDALRDELDEAAEAARAATVRRLRMRETALLKAHEATWTGKLPLGTRAARMARGFVDAVEWTTHDRSPEAMVASVAALMAAAPMLRALMHYLAPSTSPTWLPTLQALLGCQELGQLRSLGFYSLHELEGARALGRCTTLTSLRRLYVGSPLTDEGLKVILEGEGEVAARLESLEANGSGLSSASAKVIAARPMALRELQLRSNRLGVEGVQALAASPHLTGLRLLGLLDNQLGAEGVRALAGATFASSLRALDVRKNRIGEDGARALGAGFPALRTLDLTGNSLGAKGIRALVAGDGLGNLRELCLQQTSLDEPAIVALAGAPLLGRLRRLSLRSNKLGDGAVRALAASRHARGLETLNLNNNKISAAAIAALKAGLPETRIAVKAA